MTDESNVYADAGQEALEGIWEFYRCRRAVLAAEAEVSVTAVVLHRNRRLADETLHVLPGEESGPGQ